MNEQNTVLLNITKPKEKFQSKKTALLVTETVGTGVEITVREEDWRRQTPQVQQIGQPLRRDLDPHTLLADTRVGVAVGAGRLPPVGEYHGHIHTAHGHDEVKEIVFLIRILLLGRNTECAQCRCSIGGRIAGIDECNDGNQDTHHQAAHIIRPRTVSTPVALRVWVAGDGLPADERAIAKDDGRHKQTLVEFVEYTEDCGQDAEYECDGDVELIEWTVEINIHAYTTRECTAPEEDTQSQIGDLGTTRHIGVTFSAGRVDEVFVQIIGEINENDELQDEEEK